MRAPKLNLRLKIGAALAATCIAITGVVGVTLYMASEALEAALVDQIVGEEIESLMRSGGSAAAFPDGPNLQYYVARTPEDYAEIPARFRMLDPGWHSVGSDTEERRVAVRDMDGARYIVAYDAGPHELRERQFMILLLVAMGVAAMVTIGMSYWLAGVLTRQLTDLAARVSYLAPDEPHVPLARTDHDPEIAALASALDRYQARIVDMIRREQEFTANASHELRTPLTAICTSCELLATEPDLSEKGRARVSMAAAAAAQMTDRIEALLYLARQHPPAAREDVALRECVEQTAVTCREEILRKSLSFELAIGTDVRVRLDRKALELVVGNLIRNAVRYTEHGYVRVSYDGYRLSVADSGTGIASQHLPRVFERFYRGEGDAEGFGIGLAIVRRICDQFDWKIEVASDPGAGSVFSIVLP